jgi:hypothetical protein
MQLPTLPFVVQNCRAAESQCGNEGLKWLDTTRESSSSTMAGAVTHRGTLVLPDGRAAVDDGVVRDLVEGSRPDHPDLQRPNAASRHPSLAESRYM